MAQIVVLPYKSEPVDLISLTFPLNLEEFITSFWDTDDFYLKFSMERALEKHIRISPWQKSVLESRYTKYQRIVRKNHPLPFSLPWLPVEVTARTTQTIMQDLDKRTLFRISEHTIVKGIPYTEPHVIVHWVLHLTKDHEIKCDLSLHFEYEQVSMLRVAIESNAFVELTKYYKLYRNEVMRTISTHSQTSPGRRLPCIPSELTEFLIKNEPVVDNNSIIDSHITNPTINNDHIVPTRNMMHADAVISSQSSSPASSTEDDVIFEHEDYMMIWSFETDDLELIMRMILSVSQHDLHTIWLREHDYIWKNITRILLIATIISLETSSWCPYHQRLWSYTKIIVFISSFYVLSVTILDQVRTYMIKKRDSHYSKL